MKKMKTVTKGRCFIPFIHLCLIDVILPDSESVDVLGKNCEPKSINTAAKKHESADGQSCQ